MVIPSDITKWGFVEEIPTTEEEKNYSEVTITYKSYNWLILITRNPVVNNSKEMYVYTGPRGYFLGKAIVESPNDVYALLKKVGYLTENSTNDHNKIIAQ